MITCIEALNYRCLRYIRQELEPFQILVGPNANGKSTFMDVVALLGEIAQPGVGTKAIDRRSQDLQELLHHHEGDRCEFAIEFRMREVDRSDRTCRYEIEIGHATHTNEVCNLRERVRLVSGRPSQFSGIPDSVFGGGDESRGDLLVEQKFDAARSLVVYERSSGNLIEVPTSGVSPTTSVLHWVLDSDPANQLLSTVASELRRASSLLMLDSLQLRKPSPPGHGLSFQSDGSNLPFVIDHFKTKSPERFKDWIAHVHTALPDLVDIHVIEREEDRHKYLKLEYAGGLRVPSWLTSDGTLRLLALTLIGYLPDLEGIFLIEEPENGIHPAAMETVYQALRSGYGAQVLLATHSPILLGCAEPHEILCFGKDDDGATTIVRGDVHPAFKRWQGNLDMQTLFASGVLG